LHKYQNTHIAFGNFFLEDLGIDEIMWKNIAELDRPQVTIYIMSHGLCVLDD